MLSSLGMGGALGDNMRTPENGRQDTYYDGYTNELGLLLKDRGAGFETNQKEEEREALFHRSGSAPPSVEGSLAAMGGLFSKYSNNPSYSGIDTNASDPLEAEEQLRSDPEYLAYYYANVNLNPRLPPPLISRENWRLAQRMGVMRQKGNLRSVDNRSSRSLFLSQPVLATHKEESETPMEGDQSSVGNLFRQSSTEWAEGGTDGLIGVSPIGLGTRRKSFVDLIQDEFPARTHSPAFSLSRPASRATLDDNDDQMPGLDSTSTSVDMQMATVLGSRSSTPNPLSQGNLSNGLSSASTTAGLQRAMSLGLAEQSMNERQVPRNSSIGTSGLASALQNMSLSDRQESASSEDRSYPQQKLQEEAKEANEKSWRPQQMQGQVMDSVQSSAYAQAFLQLQQQQLAQAASLNPAALQSGMMNPNIYAAAAAAAAMSYMSGGNPYYQNSHLAGLYSPQYGLGGSPVNSSLLPAMMMNFPSAATLPVPFDSAATMAAAVAAAARVSNPGSAGATGMGLDMQQLYRMGGQSNASLQVPPFDPVYVQYLQRLTQDARLVSALQDQSSARGYMGGGGGAFADFLAMQKSHSLPGVGLSVYPNNPLSSPTLPSSPLTHSSSPSQHNERSPRMGSSASSGGSLRATGMMTSLHLKDRAGDPAEESHVSSLLEEFKNNKARNFELSDIVGKVTEFSADQHGSRFIQQKLEVANPEEKNFVFQEIFPQALTLMTDVFGNYVIQKLFEHGNPPNRRELANQLIGHVLSLSLQMYGCRVIQKAIEAVDVDQQTQLVAELDGHVMRCVRDQNGNHVIQKCIECVPQHRIQFIISSFLGQVVALSTHPYGCRVIQRVLEHCSDEGIQQRVMDEIVPSVCTLSQDQYGNYVVQHILEHGKPHERASIIKKLAGQVVQMSQHKFASNVVEKCLAFGGLAERQLLITHILGDTDENEPLQAMMKDQFGNYVVQKVLETCDERQRDIVLARIKVHLHSLKKYTYGKHIVARVEKLVAAGERRSAMHSAQKATM